MKRLRVKAFGLIELMISLILASIVVVGLYQYFIKGTRKMSDVIIKTGVENMAIRAYNGIISDIKLLGHNPEEIINAPLNPAVDPNNGFLNIGTQNMMGIALAIGDMPIDMPLYRPARDPRMNPRADFEVLAYSSFYEDQPACCGNDTDSVTNLPSPKFSDMTCNPICSDAWDGMTSSDANICCCQRYSITNGTISKEYWDFSINQPAKVVLLNNACLRFIYWDIDNDAPCACQDGRKCPNTDTSGTNPCPDDFLDKPPKAIKLILAAVMDDRYKNSFIAGCQLAITSFLMPTTVACDVSLECSIDPDILNPSQYVRFEKVIYLSNLSK